MNRLSLALGIVLAGGVVWTLAAQGQDPSEEPSAPQSRTSQFMRLKLEHAKDLMEGIVLEDYDQIAKSSQAISLLTHDENWPVRRSVDYVRMSESFRRSADDITNAAEKHNLEAAALSYMQMTMNCVACHKYLRGEENHSEDGADPTSETPAQ